MSSAIQLRLRCQPIACGSLHAKTIAALNSWSGGSLALPVDSQSHEVIHRLYPGVTVYLADPHSPWQRGIDENTNGLLRPYVPKGRDLSGFTQKELDAIAWKINPRSRKSLGFRCPVGCSPRARSISGSIMLRFLHLTLETALLSISVTEEKVMAKKKSPASGMMPEDKRIKAAIRAYLPVFISENPFSRYGVHGIGIGPKSVKGKRTGPICLRFYVDCKCSPKLLPPDRKVPERIRVPMTPSHTLEVPTDVIEMPRPSLSMEDPESLLRPVPGGASISVPGSGGNGTLGAWVLDKTDETVVALSNRHVLGGTNGAVVIQPGSNDGGSAPKDRIGTVKRNVAFALAPANPTPSDCNLIDAAILMADDPDLIDLRVIDLGTAIYTIDTAEEGDPVQKTGKTTGYTTGTVVDDDYNFLIQLPITPGNFKDVVFCDLYLVEKDATVLPPGFSSFGDSGSVLFGFASEPDAVIHPAIGLNFAYADARTVACKIQNVFDALDLDVLCASGYPAYLDSIAEDGADSGGLQVATRFTGAERRTRAATRVTAGLARDVERRLKASAKGQEVVDLVRRFRHPIFAQLIRQSDLRRAMTEALRPVLSGARTSDDVLNYEIDQGDLDRVNRVMMVLKREGMDDIATAIKSLAITGKNTKGKRLLALLDLRGD